MVEPVTTAVVGASLFSAGKLFEFAFGGMVGNLASSAATTSLALAKRLIKRDGRPVNHDVARSIHTAFVKSMQAIVVDAQAAPQDARDRFSLVALSELIKSNEITVWNAEDVQIPYEQLEQNISQIYGRQGVPAKQAATDRLIAFLEQRLPDALAPIIADVLRNGHNGPSWADLFELFFAEEVKTNERVFRILLLDRTNELIEIATTQAAQIVQIQKSIEDFSALILDKLDKIVGDGEKVLAAIAEMDRPRAADAPLVRGIRKFKAETAAPGSFRAYLESGQLLYCPRADFAASNGIANQFEFDEVAMLAYLESGPHQVLVLSGPGGVGKTRLSLELGQRLVDADDRIVAILDAAARGPDLERFVKAEQHAKFAFILDYGETASNLDDLVQTIDALVDQKGSEIALIVTCRDSAAGKVVGSVSPLDSKVLSLSAETGNVAKYQEWLTSSILSHIDEADRGALANTCRSVPALAAFALFLYRSHRPLFDEQFLQLGATEDFTDWIERRASVVMAQAAGSASTLAELALSLPMPLSFRNKLIDGNDEKSRLLKALEADRWVEPEGDQLVPAHDVLADGLAARWLLGSRTQVTANVGDALRRAFTEDRLRTALQVLDRLAYHANFSQLDGARVLDTLRRQKAFDESDYLVELLGGRLLDPDEKVELLLSDPDYADIVMDDPSLWLALTSAIESLADWGDLNDHDQSDAIIQRNERLYPLLDRIAYSANAPSNILIRRLYHFAPKRYCDQALRNIDLFPLVKQTHFLLAEMLRSGEPLDLLTERVLHWLEEHGAKVDRASYVYEAWLERKGDPELIQVKMLEWFENFGLRDDAAFVMNAWLRSTHQVPTIAKYLHPWLDNFGTVPVAGHVVEAYARADNLGPDSRAAITTYMAECAEDRIAGLVYAAWLDICPDDEHLDDLIQNYLLKNRSYRQLSTVLGRWIKARGATQSNKEHMDAWCPLALDSGYTNFVLTAWLDRGGSVDDCKTYADGWLDHFGKRPIAQHFFIAIMRRFKGLDEFGGRVTEWRAVQRLHPSSWSFYATWLKNGLGVEAISDDFLAWLDLNHLAEGADGMMRAWLDIDAPFKPIKPFALAWLNVNREHPDAVYLTKKLSDQQALPDQSVTDIAVWAMAFYESEDAVWRLGRLRDKLDWVISADPIEAYLDASQFCIDYHYDKFPRDKHFLLDRLISAFGKYFDWVEDPKAVCAILRKAICEGKIYSPKATFVMQDISFQVIPIMIRHGALDPITDRQTIEQFMAMMRRNDHDRRFLTALLVQLGDVAPQIDWKHSGLGSSTTLDPIPNPP